LGRRSQLILVLGGPQEGKMTKRLVAIGGLLLALAGCYESNEPLDAPARGRVERRLVGDWQCMNHTHGDTPTAASLWVIPFDDRQYYAEWREGDDVARYRAYSTQVGGETLLNVEELSFKLSSAGWVFVRSNQDRAGRLTLSVVRRDALNGLTGKAALRSIAKRARDETLYELVAVCTQAKS